MGAQYISGRNLSAIGILCAFVGAAQATGNQCAGGYSDSFEVVGKVAQPFRVAPHDLANYPTSSIEVSYYSGQEGFLTRRYTGVLLGDLLKAAVVQTDPAVKGDILRKYVVVSASDCYEVVLPVSDVLPDYGGQQILVAFADGQGKSLGTDGFAKLVVPGDKRASRYVSNIVRIRVRSAP